jgi:hypothetical protein
LRSLLWGMSRVFELWRRRGWKLWNWWQSQSSVALLDLKKEKKYLMIDVYLCPLLILNIAWKSLRSFIVKDKRRKLKFW